MALPQPRSTLRRKSSWPVWVSIAWRVLAVMAMVAFAIMVHYLDREGLRDNYDGDVSLLDVIYFTAISITTTGYGDIAPVSDRARMFDALLLTPIRVFVVLLFVGTAYQFVLKRTWDKWRMSIIQKHLTGHTVIAGFGQTGSETAEELIKRGAAPRTIVVVDCTDDRLEAAEALGCTVLKGDATRDQTLADVKIADARALIVAPGRDDTAVLITLTARHLAPTLPISVIVSAEDNELPARAAGATTVINPVSMAGLMLASTYSGPHIASYLTDLASINGPIALCERPVGDADIGRPLARIGTGQGLRIYRDGKAHDHLSPEAQSLRPGDTILEIVDIDP